MNREIKFKAWDKTKRKMLFWRNIYEANDFWSDVNYPSTLPVMQYTGLKDKNGVEIYEGDVLNSDKEKIDGGVDVLVEWCGSGFYCGYGPHIPITAILEKDAEIIGNIYQNPELIK